MDFKINPDIKPLSATLKRLNIGKSFLLKDFPFELEERNIDDFWDLCIKQSGYIFNILTSNPDEKLTEIFIIGISLLYDKYVNFNGINNQDNFNEFLEVGLNFYIKNNTENSDYTKLISELEKIKIVYSSLLNEIKKTILEEKNKKELRDTVSKVIKTRNEITSKLNPPKKIEKNRKYQVFISSTFTDLIEERQAAVEAILKKGHIPAGMELFTAGDKSQWEVIKRWIDDSDIYLLILGGRYGSINKTTGLSYTEMEYKYAIEKGKPFFALSLSNEILDKKPIEIIKEYDLKDPKYISFKEVVKSKICSFPKSIDQIKIEINHSLDTLIFDNKENMQGWIKGNI